MSESRLPGKRLLADGALYIASPTGLRVTAKGFLDLCKWLHADNMHREWASAHRAEVLNVGSAIPFWVHGS